MESRELVAGELLSTYCEVKISLKRKIRYNGQEYSDPNQLPPEGRAAYEKAMSDGAFTKKIVINAEVVTEQNEAARKLCDDVMNIIGNSGTTASSGSPRAEPLMTKRQLHIVLLLVVIVLVACWLFTAK